MFYIFLFLATMICYTFGESLFEDSSAIVALNVMAGSINGRFSQSVNKKLSVLSILINNYCNLSCKHCYLKAKKFGDYLSQLEWEQFFHSAFASLKPETICFAGKEVFFNDESAHILFNAVEQRNLIQRAQNNKTEIGVITNGTLLHHYKGQISETGPDYFDMSIDGLPAIHDEIRGKGAFKNAAQNLEWLMKNYKGNIWITHTVLINNLDTLPSFIEYMHHNFGITNFSIGLYKEKPHTDQTLKLNENNLKQLLNDTFNQLKNLSLNHGVKVMLEMDHTQKDFLPILLDSGWVKSRGWLSSTRHDFDNNLQLEVNTAEIPVGLWRAVRVTPEGYWLASEDLMEVKNYNQVAVANLRDHQFNAKALYQKGLLSNRFDELVGNQKNQLKSIFSKEIITP